jgi:hypothetical protein
VPVTQYDRTATASKRICAFKENRDRGDNLVCQFKSDGWLHLILTNITVTPYL